MTHNSYKEILIVAGEASADRYGARLVRKLRSNCGEGDRLRFFGTGGDEMEKAGVQLLAHVRDLASIGPLEGLAHLREYYKTYQSLVHASIERPAALALLIDFPEFNLRLAKRMKRAGIRVVYYIGPQLWAWRRGRIRTVQACVDRMLVILPFEEEYYRRHGVRAEFVGHPLLEEPEPKLDREHFHRRFHLDSGRKTIALLPGSRRKEIDYILPTLLRASLRVLEEMPAQFVISAAPTIGQDHIRRVVSSILQDSPNADCFQVVTIPSRDILAHVDFGFVKSGTSTLEAALVGTPFLIVYKISRVSWYAGNLLIRSPFKGLVNLIAQEKVVPEFFQGNATPEALCRTALEYLRQPEKTNRMKARLADIRRMLSLRCATDAVADVVRSYL